MEFGFKRPETLETLFSSAKKLTNSCNNHAPLKLKFYYSKRLSSKSSISSSVLLKSSQKVNFEKFT